MSAAAVLARPKAVARRILKRQPPWRREFSLRVYQSLNPDLSFATLDEALSHFLTHGVDEVRQVSLRYRFEPDFYRAYYPDLAHLDAGAAYRHWLDAGEREKRLPSEAALMRSLDLPSDVLPAAFSAEAYRSRNSDLNGLTDLGAFEHFVRWGAKEGREPPLAAGEGIDFLLQLSGAYARAGDLRGATWAYEQALAVDADDPEALHRYGDFFLGMGSNYAASKLYEPALQARPDHLWTLINQGTAKAGLRRHAEAVSLFRKVLAREPGLAFVRSHLRKTAAELFERRWSAANLLARRNALADARAAMRLAVDDYVRAVEENEPPLPPPASEPVPPRVAILGSDSIPQCLHYRVKQKVAQLEAADVPVSWWGFSDMAGFKNRLHAFHVVIFYRVPATPAIIDLIRYARRLGLTIFYEIDDLIFDEANYPPPLESFAGLVTAEEYPGLVTGTPLFSAAMEMCDYGIASTPPLQAVMARFVRSGRCHLHRNGLGPDHERVAPAVTDETLAVKRARPEVVAFFGSGSRSHNENFDRFAAPALAAAFERHPNLRLRVIGHLALSPELQRFADRIELIDFVSNTEAYWLRLAEADINLAPLTPSVFNDSKSEIKWLEAAMLAVPSVVSGSPVYREALEDGSDALIADTPAEWAQALDRLVADAALREVMGQAARAKAFRNYGMDTLSANIRGIVTEGRRATRGEVPASTPKPRVLVVNVFYPPQAIGGATRLVQDNVETFRRDHADSFDVEVFCSTDSGAVPGEVDRYDWNGAPVTALTPYPVKDFAIADSSPKTGAAFRQLLEDLRPQLIHFHAVQRLTASLLDEAKAAGVPYLVTAHDGWWISDHQFLLDGEGLPVTRSGRWGDPKRLQRLKAALSGAVHVLAVSKTFGDLYRSRGLTNVVDVPNGVTRLTGALEMPPGDQVRLGLLGGLGAAKGADLLHAALTLTEYRNLHFTVVDHGAPEGSLRAEYWGRNRVEIIGKIPQDKVGGLYARLHGVLAPSVCLESFGLVTREALSLGRWVVASDRGAIGEDVVEGVNGFVVDVSDPLGLMSALRVMNAQPDRFRVPPPAGPPPRTSQDQADELAALYRRILDAGAAAATPPR